tara:strand:+ start:3702 stop:5018 length:1317 start_codon:yes stop_codon:yes gene_type:complete
MNLEFFTWRKGIILSATFLFSVFVMTSCKKKENILGQNTLAQDELLNSSGIDTFTLHTYTIQDDSISTGQPLYGLLGSYNDPVFGTVNGEIYTQLNLSLLAPSFADLDSVIIDSFVLSLRYNEHYGIPGNQTFEVFEITDTDGIDEDSTYYTFSTKTTDPVSWIPAGEEVIKMDPDAITVVGSDTVPTQLRIPLDTNKARTIFEDFNSTPASFATNEDFVEYFKGLHIRTVNGLQAPGDGGVFYFDLGSASSEAVVYYTENGVQKEFQFLINSSTANFNHIDVDNSMTNVETVINTPSAGNLEFYAQAFSSRAVVSIPGIANIPANAVIHKAILELPIQYQTGANYYPGSALTVSRRESTGSDSLIFTGAFAVYDDFTKQFDVDIRNHVQQIVNGEITDTDLVLSPLSFITSVDRVIFNGAQTGNKVQPKISILYTEF